MSGKRITAGNRNINKHTQRILLPEKAIESLDKYLAVGGGKALAQALSMPPHQIIAEIKESRLRGRGGAGFPTGVKWASVAYASCPTKYLVCNGAEGEPGTFKDRYLMRQNPYQLLEGIAIAAFAIGAKKAFLGIKRSFEREFAAVSHALEEMSARDRLGQIPIEIVRGPEDYLFGEETALLEVIEGGAPLPREAGMAPYIRGLFVTDPAQFNPTAVNNVETLSNVPHILLHGADWFRAIGSPDSPGTMVFTVSGDVRRPGIYELPMGTPLRELIYEHAGGLRRGRTLKAVFSGVSNAIILPEAIDTPMDFDALRRIGSGLGSAGFIVYDDTACMVQVAYRFSEFLSVESCVQCISCKFGTSQATECLQRLVQGSGAETDLDDALAGAAMAPYGNRCYLPVQHSLLIPSIIEGFASEFQRHYHRGCRGCRTMVLPKMADFDESEGVFVYSRGLDNRRY